jgi:alcohol dehydrogenase class IV
MLEGWVSTSIAQQVVVGPGALRALPEVLKALGLRRVLLVTTSGRSRAEGTDGVRRQLGRSLAATFDQVERGVPATAVQAGVRHLRSETIDGIVSLGGGAAIDTAKALAFFFEHESGTPAAGFADRPMLPHVAIPTTLVGAAYTSWFSMIDPATRRSSTAGAPTMTPSAVLVEPELGADLPGELLAGSIAALLGHGIEALWSPGRTPESDALASAGLARLAAGAAAAVAEAGDIERRGALLDAAVLCGRARAQAGDGMHHVLAQLLSARSAAPYGAVHAALLPATVRFTLEAVPQVDATVSEVLADAAGGAAAGHPGADAVDVLLGSLGPRQGLSDLGFTDDDLDAVARQSGSHRGVQVHPRPAGEADVRALLDDAW